MLHLSAMESTKYNPPHGRPPQFPIRRSRKTVSFSKCWLRLFRTLFHRAHKSHCKLEQQYVCLFTCLVTRSVHLEVCQTLDTDSCLLAIRRFVSRRGYPKLIIFDNGSNFTSAKKMLDLNNFSVENNYSKSQLQQQNIKWKLNPTLAPHFGGNGKG